MTKQATRAIARGLLWLIVAVAFAVLCIAHAGTCPDPPLFDASGPVCTDARELVECGCSECFYWDATTGAEYFEVQRHDPGGAVGIVGVPTIHSAYTEEGVYTPAQLTMQWCFAKDAPMPIEGLTYEYEVRACSSRWMPPCSNWGGSFGLSVVYTAAPYRVYP